MCEGDSKCADFAPRLLAWFAANGRRLPWRDEPTPYRVTVSEFMLQQTQVERVVPIFERFVARFDSFASLAHADLADVIRAWQGLGYNSRAVRLHRLAQAVCARLSGELPDEESLLRTLPGVGPYTARAILAFAFDRDAVAADTNVRRVVHRFAAGLEWPPRLTPRELDAIAGRYADGVSSFAFNSALMDLGATICTARAPVCGACPLAASCAAAPVDVAKLALLARSCAPRRTPQARLPFERSMRHLRGRIVDRLRALGPHQRISLLLLNDELRAGALPRETSEIETAVLALTREGLIECSDGELSLARSSEGYSNA